MKIVNNFFVNEEEEKKNKENNRQNTEQDRALSREKKTKFLKINRAKFLDIVEKSSLAYNSHRKTNRSYLSRLDNEDD